MGVAYRPLSMSLHRRKESAPRWTGPIVVRGPLLGRRVGDAGRSVHAVGLREPLRLGPARQRRGRSSTVIDPGAAGPKSVVVEAYVKVGSPGWSRTSDFLINSPAGSLTTDVYAHLSGQIANGSRWRGER